MNIRTLLDILDEQRRNSPAGDGTEVKFVIRARFDVRQLTGDGLMRPHPFGSMALDFAPTLIGVRNDVAEIATAETGEIRLIIE